MLTQIVDSVEAHLQLKTQTPREDKKALQDYYRDFIVARSHQDRMQAYLWRDHGSHTSANLNDYSVSSFIVWD